MRLLLLVVALATASGQELRPGVWTGADLSSLPIPASGYEAYLLGEMHGVKQMETVFEQYLRKLNQANGLRDVAIEEGGVNQEAAEAYVEGRSDRLPASLCLRAWILTIVRNLNQGRTADRRIRVHLVDIDSPAAAIREHLLAVQRRLPGGAAVKVPPAADIRERGLQAVDELKKLAAASPLAGELRTIAHSIGAYRQGLEIGTGQTKGSSYLEDREQAIASNIEDLVHELPSGVFVIFGSDHVSRNQRKDGGPDRNATFAPMAMRLEAAGVKTVSVIAYPLGGSYAWRGAQQDMLWTAENGHLANGETLDKVLEAGHQPDFLYIDARREKATIPSDDITRYRPDGFLLMRKGTPLEDRCSAK